MTTPQDNIFLGLQKILYAYYQRRIPSTKTIDTSVIAQKLFNSGIVRPGNLSTLDGKYCMVSDSSWNDIIDIFWARKMQWISDTWDCDKFGIAFKAMCNELGINSCAMVIGDKTPKKEGDPGHFFNLFLNDNLDIYVVEPQTGEKALYVPGKEISIGGSIYTISTVII